MKRLGRIIEIGRKGVYPPFALILKKRKEKLEIELSAYESESIFLDLKQTIKLRNMLNEFIDKSTKDFIK